MTIQSEVDGRGNVRKKDALLVGSMFVIYTVCCILFVSGSFIWIEKDRKIARANATVTQAAAATQQANVTATAIAHATELAQYDVIDQFDSNNHRWLTGFEDNRYWVGSRHIKDGIYSWDVETVKETFISWANFSSNEWIKDFDAYVDTKILDAQPGKACSGFIFRKTDRGKAYDYYYFALCNNSVVNVSFHGANEGWERIATVSSYIIPNDWNRLEINARGAYFTFMINGILIYEMNDDRLDTGGLALVIELNENVPARFLFDNFGYQWR
jgi:hypothetical protein